MYSAIETVSMVSTNFVTKTLLVTYCPVTIKTSISNLVHTAHFWNNHIFESQIIQKSFRARKPKGPNKIAKIS